MSTNITGQNSNKIQVCTICISEALLFLCKPFFEYKRVYLETFWKQHF